MGFSLLFDIIYVTLQSYYYQIIIVDMKKTLLTLAIMAATTTTANAENLFKTLLGKTDAEVDRKIENIWGHFFTPGDLSLYEADGQKTVYYNSPDGLAFVMDTGSNDVRTEGMSYGMMISVQLARYTTPPHCLWRQKNGTSHDMQKRLTRYYSEPWTTTAQKPAYTTSTIATTASSLSCQTMPGMASQTPHTNCLPSSTIGRKWQRKTVSFGKRQPRRHETIS